MRRKQTHSYQTSTIKSWSTLARRRGSPATPLDAVLSFTVFGPVVISEILHGQGVLAQHLLVLTVLTPDLFKVAHWKKTTTSDRFPGFTKTSKICWCCRTAKSYSAFWVVTKIMNPLASFGHQFKPWNMISLPRKAADKPRHSCQYFDASTQRISLQKAQRWYCSSSSTLKKKKSTSQQQ